MSLFTSKHEETGGEGGEVSANIKQRRSAVLSPSYPQLTEETLLELEQSLPNYRLAQRNLNHWLYYIKATVKDTFDTFRISLIEIFIQELSIARHPYYPSPKLTSRRAITRPRVLLTSLALPSVLLAKYKS